MILDDAIAAFKQHHGGRLPTEILVTPRASIILSAQATIGPSWRGVPVRIGAEEPVEIGKGSKLLLICQTDGLQRPGVYAAEAGPSF